MMKLRKNNDNGGTRKDPKMAEFFKNGGKEITVRDLERNLSEIEAGELLCDTSVSGKEQRRMERYVRKHQST